MAIRCICRVTRVRRQPKRRRLPEELRTEPDNHAKRTDTWTTEVMPGDAERIGIMDQAAAVLILQAFLEARANQRGRDGGSGLLPSYNRSLHLNASTHQHRRVR